MQLERSCRCKVASTFIFNALYFTLLDFLNFTQNNIYKHDETSGKKMNCCRRIVEELCEAFLSGSLCQKF